MRYSIGKILKIKCIGFYAMNARNFGKWLPEKLKPTESGTCCVDYLKSCLTFATICQRVGVLDVVPCSSPVTAPLQIRTGQSVWWWKHVES